MSTEKFSIKRISLREWYCYHVETGLCVGRIVENLYVDVFRYNVNTALQSAIVEDYDSAVKRCLKMIGSDAQHKIHPITVIIP